MYDKSLNLVFMFLKVVYIQQSASKLLLLWAYNKRSADGTALQNTGRLFAEIQIKLMI